MILRAGNDSVVSQMTTEEYHQDYSRISSTMLKRWLESRREYEAVYITKTQSDVQPTRAMDLGSVVHAVLLEGENLGELAMTYPSWAMNKDGGLIGVHSAKVRAVQKRFSLGEDYREIVLTYPSVCFVAGSGNRRSKEIAKFEADNPGRVFLTQDQSSELEEMITKGDRPPKYVLKNETIDMAVAIVDQLKTHEAYKYITHGDCLHEHKIGWRNEKSGLDSRAMLDFLIIAPKKTYSFDIKVTINWRTEDFRHYLSGKSRSGQRGWVQAAHYADGVVTKYERPSWMRFLCINPEPPHQMRLNRVPDEMFSNLQEKHQETMNDLAYAIDRKDFSDPGEQFDHQVVTLHPDDLC